MEPCLEKEPAHHHESWDGRGTGGEGESGLGAVVGGATGGSACVRREGFWQGWEN